MMTAWTGQRLLLPCAALGLLGTVLGAFFAPAEMARAWLTMALLLLGFPLGALVVLMIGNLTGGRWIETTRHLLLALAGTLPLALLALVPLLLVPQTIFPWVADPQHLSLTAQHKLAFLNLPGLTMRFAVLAALWLAVAFANGVWSGGAPRLVRGRALAGGLGLAIHALLLTVFATDWMLALEPDFYSTIYPMLVATEQAVQALAAVMLLLSAFTDADTQAGGAPEASLGGDLARLLLAGVFFWGYLAFMQWVVIWSGDLPDEIGWYLVRLAGGWQAINWAAIACAFAVPFVGLISRRGKHDPAWRRAIVAIALLGQLLEGLWRIAPAFPATPLLFGLMLPALLALAATGSGMALLLHRRQTPVALRKGAHGAAG